MIDAKAIFSRPFLRLTALSFLPIGLAPLLQYLTVSPFGSEIFLWFETFLVLPFLTALLGVIISPFLLFSPKLRLSASRFFIGSFIFGAAVFIGAHIGGQVRMAAFQRLAQRSSSLVQAVRSYEARYKNPPPDLAALVPEFLPTFPGTGMAAYPHYEYHVGKDAARYDGNPWVIVVFTPSGGINFDTFMYFPRQNYPQTGYGGSLERVLDWAYVHE